MKGAVSSVVLIVIAVIVIIGIGYSFVSKKTSSSSASTVLNCDETVKLYCREWGLDDYNRGSVLVGGRPGPWSSYSATCANTGIQQPTADICRRRLAG